jgi:hypothetical protein
MREECKHFQSRTYGSGEVARFCRLDMAPEAPWRCPADCAKYERRMGDAGWSVGSLVAPPVEQEPSADAEEIGALLDQAEDIINTAGPIIVAEVSRQRERTDGPQPWWRRRLRRR